jgi:ribosomal protein L6P/L9E
MLINKKVKSIKIANIKQIGFCFLQGQKFLLFKTKMNSVKYFLCPEFISFNTNENNLILSLMSDKQEDIFFFDQYYSNLMLFINNLEYLVKKKLKLKGLGLKMSLSSDSKTLEFKLGFSHSILLEIPNTNINVNIQKNVISVEGVDSVEVGNFTNKIRSLKFPDSYKGKGFWYKSEKEKLKEIKKK